MRRLLLALAMGSMFVLGAEVAHDHHADAAACKTRGRCTACSNCSKCKPCAKDGGTCSVCRPPPK